MKRCRLIVGIGMVMMFAAVCRAQVEPKQVLRDQYEKKVHAIAAELDGILGIAVKNLETGETFSYNEDGVFTQASAIKVEILYEVFKQARQGRFALDDPLTMEKKDVTPGSGVLQKLTPGSVTLSIIDYATLMITESDNTATNMMIDLVGMKNVNQTVRDLGLTETKLQRKMIDTEAWMQNRENISTPNEAVNLLEIIYRASDLDRESCEEMLRIMSIPKHSRIRPLLPRGVRVAHKTGSVRGVVCDVGIVYLKNSPFVIAGMVNWCTD